jgi:hypothetical protein
MFGFKPAGNRLTSLAARFHNEMRGRQGYGGRLLDFGHAPESAKSVVTAHHFFTMDTLFRVAMTQIRAAHSRPAVSDRPKKRAFRWIKCVLTYSV